VSVLVLLIFASLAIATVFLAAFIWAVRSGQYEDTCTPSMRLLLDERPASRNKTNFPLKQDKEENP
jgi:cbb3-type cytochrome oxidase maturation protein